MQGFPVDADGLGIEVDFDVAGADDGVGMPLGTTDNSLNPGQQFGPVKRLGQVIVGAVTQPFDFFVRFGQAGQNQHRRFDFGRTQAFEHFVSVHVGQHQVENDDVIVIKLADFQSVFAQIRRIYDHSFFFQHGFNALRNRIVVFNQ